MQFIRNGDVVAMEKYCMQQLREEAEYRIADVGMGACDETNYVTYWMASHRDQGVAYEMIKLFDKAIGRDPYVWEIFNAPTQIAARVRGHEKILQFLPPVQLVHLYDTDII